MKMNAPRTLALAVWLLGFSTGGAADAPKNEGSPSDQAFDVRAERARRDTLKRAKQVEEVERMRKAGEAFQIKYVEPKFPAGAATRIYSVQVTALIHVDEEGVVRGIRLESPSNPAFDWAVVEAVWQWRYSPQKAGANAIPIDIRTIVSVVRPTGEGANSERSASPEREAGRRLNKPVD